jgi:hypothetical protein
LIRRSIDNRDVAMTDGEQSISKRVADARLLI